MTELCLACKGDGEHDRGQYLWHVQVPAAHSITNPHPAHDPGPPSVFRHNNTLQSMRGGAAVTWPKVNACRGTCASITKTWEGRRSKGRCTCARHYLVAWKKPTSRHAGLKGAPLASLWCGVLVPFTLMASVSALTLSCDSSLQHFGQQSVVLIDLQLPLL